MLTMIDRTSRWPEVVPMSDITAEKCADSFVEGWISRFGVPDVVTTDRGTQFTSATWACLASKLGFKHVLTSSYHPQSNGMVERLHRQIKDALCARACSNAWAEHLPWVMLGIRAAPKEDSGISSARMVYGEELGSLRWQAAAWRTPNPHRTAAASSRFRCGPALTRMLPRDLWAVWSGRILPTCAGAAWAARHSSCTTGRSEFWRGGPRLIY
jgi:Integrase core domain